MNEPGQDAACGYGTNFAFSGASPVCGSLGLSSVVGVRQTLPMGKAVYVSATVQGQSADLYLLDRAEERSSTELSMLRACIGLGGTARNRTSELKRGISRILKCTPRWSRESVKPGGTRAYGQPARTGDGMRRLRVAKRAHASITPTRWVTSRPRNGAIALLKSSSIPARTWRSRTISCGLVAQPLTSWSRSGARRTCNQVHRHVVALVDHHNVAVRWSLITH
jgi:hypothetical protein